jgi:putative tryptophan/tyrosine transport system substrate-binding protein
VTFTDYTFIIPGDNGMRGAPIDRFVKSCIILLTVFSLSGLWVTCALAEKKILTIQSSNITPYEDALKGFQSTCSYPVDSFVLSEMKGRDVIQVIKNINPSVILSIGMDALDKIKGIEDVPIIYVMVTNTQLINSKVNFTGVRMSVAQEQQLAVFLKAIPSVKKIGLLYNPDKTGYMAQRASEACKKTGINLIAREVRDPRECPAAIKSMAGKIDGFWMFPDSSIFTAETLEYLFLFSIGNKVPILTFSEIYLDSGALVSVGVDPFDMGAQAGWVACEILEGKPVSSLTPVDARKQIISVNVKAAEKLGIYIDEKSLNGARLLK